jgi:hypothetical protein
MNKVQPMRLTAMPGLPVKWEFAWQLPVREHIWNRHCQCSSIGSNYTYRAGIWAYRQDASEVITGITLPIIAQLPGYTSQIANTVKAFIWQSGRPDRFD